MENVVVHISRKSLIVSGIYLESPDGGTFWHLLKNDPNLAESLWWTKPLSLPRNREVALYGTKGKRLTFTSQDILISSEANVRQYLIVSHQPNGGNQIGYFPDNWEYGQAQIQNQALMALAVVWLLVFNVSSKMPVTSPKLENVLAVKRYENEIKHRCA